MNDEQIAAAVEVAVTVVRQDQCADGYHDFGALAPDVCSCGATIDGLPRLAQRNPS